ncbi:hypothetical protein SAMN05444320_10170 [Streptoalloteichus hindustanus]|uniref:Uncharacterized protein n=1 Tax=Streptoalloteichus hindustanus TaxID=2017 RepID=A0A1M4TFQ0_STRHI|nr:hypothetical protein SAMN05444320_10170 [Streptoalloteichus hindustanus]
MTAWHVLRCLIRIGPREVLREVLAAEFPWLRHLPAEGRDEFVDVFTAAETARWTLLGQLIHERKATAAVHADPVLHAALTRSVDAEEGGQVPPPAADHERAGEPGSRSSSCPCRGAQVR